MKIGVVGLGKMGANIALNLLDQGVEVVGYDIDNNSRMLASKQGISVVSSIQSLVSELPKRKVIWLMVPNGNPTENAIDSLKDLLTNEDIIIDAGNSNYNDSIRRANNLKQKGIILLDAGTSGGVSGARHGACLMIGGEQEAYDYLENVFKSIAKKDGCLYTGHSGSGHFLKMVHNGIEYGMMEAIAEGFHVLKESNFDYDLEKVANNWNHGSVVRSWLMELAEKQFHEHPNLDDIKGSCYSIEFNGT